MHPANGSTRESSSLEMDTADRAEIWLGTQNNDISAQDGVHGDRASGRIKLDLLAQRADVRPPVQPTVKKGEPCPYPHLNQC